MSSRFHERIREVADAIRFAARGLTPSDAGMPVAYVAWGRRRTMILAGRDTPEALGPLVTLYEHSVFMWGGIRNLDSSDRRGAELGKVLDGRIAREPESETEPDLSH